MNKLIPTFLTAACVLAAGDPVTDSYFTNSLPWDTAVKLGTNELPQVAEWILVNGSHVAVRSYEMNWPIDGAVMHLQVLTNVTVNWFTIDVDTNSLRAFSIFKQVGELQTNRVLAIQYKNRTNQVLLDVLGKDPFPSTNRFARMPKTRQ